MNNRRDESQRELRKLDLWLQRLHRKRPVMFGLLSLAVSLAILAVVIGLKLLLDSIGR
jgi:hypothetical protein